MSNQVQNPNVEKVYDLEKRTALFGVSIIQLCKTVPVTPITKPLIGQIIRSSTSIGANYMETDACNSKKDFINKIVTCKKESKETMHWLHMFSTAIPEKHDECRRLWKEVHELVLIFSSIINKK